MPMVRRHVVILRSVCRLAFSQKNVVEGGLAGVILLKSFLDVHEYACNSASSV